MGELPPEIQQNIQFIDSLMEQFENDEEPLWKQISSMMDKIGGTISDKIDRIDEYLQKFSIKSSKKELLQNNNKKTQKMKSKKKKKIMTINWVLCFFIVFTEPIC